MPSAEKQILEIVYPSGKVYHYLNVPEKVFIEMRSTKNSPTLYSTTVCPAASAFSANSSG